MSSSSDNEKVSWILDVAETPLSFVVKIEAPDGVERNDDLTFNYIAATPFSSVDKYQYLLVIGVKKRPDFTRMLILPESIDINVKLIYSITNGVLSLTFHKLLPPGDLDYRVKKEDDE